MKGPCATPNKKDSKTFKQEENYKKNRSTKDFAKEETRLESWGRGSQHFSHPKLQKSSLTEKEKRGGERGGR